MDRWTITQPDVPRPEHRRAMLDRLVAFSDPLAGAGDWPEPELCLVIRDAAGAVAGGLWGHFYYDWLSIALIFVPDDRRGEGLGSALLAMAEAQARAWGAVGVWLDTFSFQARGFYEKKGFAVFGEIADYPPPHRRFFLSKRLDPAGPRAFAHPAIDAVPEPPAAYREAIEAPLSAFNDAAIGSGSWPDTDLALVIEDAGGTVTGGLWGRAYYRWLYVELLFVPDALRGRRLGGELLERAEAAARAAGCLGVWLDTFGFQAPDFYPRHGYTRFGEMTDYPAPHRRLFFNKRL